MWLLCRLDAWDAHAVELTIEVEGIDVGHAGDVVEHGEDAVIEARRTNLVLRRDAAQQQLRVGAVGMYGGVDDKPR